MSSYFIRYCARIRSDGASWVISGNTKAELAEFIKQERKEFRESNSHYEAEERFPAIYHRDKHGVVHWMADCTDLKFARKIVKLLNGE